MSETDSSLMTNDKNRMQVSRALVFVSMLLLSIVYTCLTLYGSWGFLLNKPDVIRLTSTSRAPLVDGEFSKTSGTLSLPDDWRAAPVQSHVWRYCFVFELTVKPTLDQDIYFPHAADNIQITVNGVEQPYFGQLGTRPDMHWSVPLIFPLKSSAFKLGRNELWVDVYANEPALGSLSSISIGPRGVFKAHKTAVYVSKRGLAYVLLAIDIFAIFAFSMYAVTVSSRFYVVNVGLCISLLGCLLPHVLNNPVVSIGSLFVLVFICFIVMMSCLMYMSALLFSVKKSTLNFIYGVNTLNIILHVMVALFIEDFESQKDYLIYLSGLIQVTGIVGTFVLVRQFILVGGAATGIVLSFALFMTALGVRDILVLWSVLPSYMGFYTLHSVAYLAICLLVVVALRIREANHERKQISHSMQLALADTRQAIDQSRQQSAAGSLDALVSRIATTYSHEFRNPLAAALATTATLSTKEWGANGHAALQRIDKSIAEISDALNQQFDFHRAMQSPEVGVDVLQYPSSLMFVSDYPSCKVVWLNDPQNMPQHSDVKIQGWLEPYLQKFGSIPSVCVVQWQQREVSLHLYLHLNASDMLDRQSLGQGSLEYLNPQRLRDLGDGQYLYWRHAFA